MTRRLQGMMRIMPLKVQFFNMLAIVTWLVWHDDDCLGIPYTESYFPIKQGSLIRP